MGDNILREEGPRSKFSRFQMSHRLTFVVENGDDGGRFQTDTIYPDVESLICSLGRAFDSLLPTGVTPPVHLTPQDQASYLATHLIAFHHLQSPFIAVYVELMTTLDRCRVLSQQAEANFHLPVPGPIHVTVKVRLGTYYMTAKVELNDRKKVLSK